MRVALAFQSFGLSASLERQRVFLARGLVEQGADVHFFGNVDDRAAGVAGVTFHPVTPRVVSSDRVRLAWEYARFARATTQALRRARFEYDIVDVAGTAAWEHDVLRVHAVTTAEAHRWPERGGRSHRARHLRAALAPVTSPKVAVASAIERLQYRPGRFSAALAVTDEVRDDLRRIHNVPDELIRVVPTAIDLERIRSAPGGALRKRLALASEEPVALFVGHDFARKGLADAITAIGTGTTRPHLAVVGNGDRAHYEKLAHELGVGDRVHFLGGASSAEAFFADADLFLLPTLEDVWGSAVIEAMAAGVPVVTTDAAGAASTVADANAGIVVPAASPAELRDAVDAVAGNATRRGEMGARGRAAAERFGITALGVASLAAYEDVLRSRRSVPRQSARETEPAATPLSTA